MRTYLKLKEDKPNGLNYWKLKIKTFVNECLTNQQIFELEDIIEKYIKDCDEINR